MLTSEGVAQLDTLRSTPPKECVFHAPILQGAETQKMSVVRQYGMLRVPWL